jgi:hypothetical protein
VVADGLVRACAPCNDAMMRRCRVQRKVKEDKAAAGRKVQELAPLRF